MFQGKKVYLVGAARSGLATARWLLDLGAQVCMNDSKDMGALSDESRQALPAMAEEGLVLELGVAADPVAWGAEYVVASPGVPLDLPALADAAAQGIPVTNEIELGWQVSQSRIVGVTGSNGKTTTTSLIGQILDDAGFTPFIGGNIGNPFIEAATGMKETDWAVLELSSFQLAGLLSMRPKIAVFLNLTPDHLDWHKSFDNYASAKWNITRYQEQDDWLILNYDDPLLRQEGEKRLREGEAWLEGKPSQKGPRILWFSQLDKPEVGVYIDKEDWVVFRRPAEEGGRETRVMPVAAFTLPGRHNRENLLAALATGLALGVKPYSLRQSAYSFKGIEHRLETVGEHEGILYVNDSKATNPDSAIKALDAYDRPILLIAGGDGKNVSFQEFAEKVMDKARMAVLIGKDREIIGEALSTMGFPEVHMKETLEEAVALCHEMAEPGDVVLLAPACASLDMFTNYEERGHVFKTTVKSLIGERRSE